LNPGEARARESRLRQGRRSTGKEKMVVEERTTVAKAITKGTPIRVIGQTSRTRS